jgi:hypothetical protein
MPFATVEELPAQALRDGKPVVLVAAFATGLVNALPATTPTASRIENFAIFRAGKFKDGAGNLNEWTHADLDQMVQNFYTLKTGGILPNVPVRENHSRDVRSIGGYFADMRRIGDILYADLEITEPDVYARYERGTYRSRSLEVGAYEANNGQIYFPVVQGVAFCDIPAVEGLFSVASSSYSAEQVLDLIEPEAGSVPDLIAASAVVVHALNKRGEHEGDALHAIEQVVKAVHEAPNPAPGDTHMDTFKFSVEGQEIDLAGDAQTQRVLAAFAKTAQEATAKVDALTEQVAEYEKNKRDAAVDRWLNDKKITPSQVEGMKAYAATLTAEQFSAHSALMEGAPALTFAAADEVADGGADDERTAKEAQVAVHSQTLNALKVVGFSREKLVDSTPYKALVALGVTPEV